MSQDTANDERNEEQQENSTPRDASPGKDDAPAKDAAKDTAKETAGERRKADQGGKKSPERIFIVPYPKVVFLYPTVVVAFIAALWMTFVDNESLGSQSRIPIALSAAFLSVLAVNMIVLTVDFPRATSLTLFFVGSTLILGSVVLVILKPDFVPFITNAVTHIRPFANATFYWILFGIMFGILLMVKLMVQFDYWEVRKNEILHHHGILSDLRRYPTAGLQVEKEINDVFEYCLLGSGRLVIRPQGEHRSFVLDNVPFIGSKEAELTTLLSSTKVKVQIDN